MTELQRHIGQFTDVPAGDIGVGGREIGYLFGQYKRIRNEFTGVLTGKALEWGGSLIRPEATGYGAVYFAEEMLATRDDGARGQDVPRLRQRQRRPVHGREADRARREADHALRLRRVRPRPGRDRSREARVRDGAEERRGAGASTSYAERYPTATFTPADPIATGNPLWAIPADCAFPSATQNEIGDIDAANLLAGGVTLVSEGANMPTRPEGVDRFIAAKILYGPGKAANAGGVAVSGLELSQDALRLNWTRDEVDAATEGDHGPHPPAVLRHGGGLRHPGQLRQRRQHRRLRQGCGRDARPGPRLTAPGADPQTVVAPDR